MNEYAVYSDDQDNDDILINIPALFLLVIIGFLIFGVFGLIFGLTRIKILWMFIAANILLVGNLFGVESMAWLNWTICLCLLSLLVRFIYLQKFDFGDNWIN